MHRLQSPAFIDPRWFQDVRYGIQEAQAVDGRSINLAGQVLRLADTEAFILLPGQQVFVTCLDRFYLITAEEQAEQLRQARERIEREKQERQEKSNRLRREAEAFNATLHVPVKWLSGIKDVLSVSQRRVMVPERTLPPSFISGCKKTSTMGGFTGTSSTSCVLLPLAAMASSGAGRQNTGLRMANETTIRPKLLVGTCLKIAERWRAEA
jgi:hypothetical protein